MPDDNKDILKGLFYFWSLSTNTFILRCGQMSFSLLDVAVITGPGPRRLDIFAKTDP